MNSIDESIALAEALPVVLLFPGCLRKQSRFATNSRQGARHSNLDPNPNLADSILYPV